MNYILNLLVRAMAKLAGSERIRRLIPALAHYAGLDLLQLAYNNIGILKYENEMVSGERFLVTSVLKKNLCDVGQPVLFDVGANIGKYSLMLAKEFPQARIHAFEPNENSFQQLVENVGKSVRCINVGMGAEEKVEKIYTYSDSLASSHASMYGDVFRAFHGAEAVAELEFQMITLDGFCVREKIESIDFLKIDTEGNELNVLRGAARMLAGGRIKIIQFEFGECDVFSRVFLRDFYELLADYHFYRLDSERLIPLFAYDSTNEIFRYQNLVAVRKSIPFRDGQ